MKLQSVVPAAAAVPSVTVGLDDDPDSTLLDCLGDVAGEHALVLGPDLGIMCALIRRGCLEVTELRQNDRPDARTADLAILPSIGSTDAAACAIAHARRGLAMSGRIVVRTVADPSGRLSQAIRSMLQMHGFSSIRVRRAMDRNVFSAELPLFGPLARA